MSSVAAVSGASGFIGSAVVRRLLRDGRPVRALIEPGAPTKNLEGLPDSVERVTVDVCDYEGMRRALQGADAFYHLAAIYKLWTPDPSTIYRVNIEGTTTSLLAAQAANVKRVIYTSSIAAVGKRDDGVPSDETIAWNLQDVANEYITTKFLSERIAMRFAEAGLPVVVVNPAFPFGARDIAPTPTGKIILGILREEMPAVGEGGFCAVDVDDVADGHVAAETRGRVGERYILGNHNVTFREFVSLVCSISGAKEPKLSVPGWVGRSITRGMETAAKLTHKEPLGTVKGLEYLQGRPFFDPSKARRELGFPCTPLSTSVEKAVAYFREQGMA